MRICCLGAATATALLLAACAEPEPTAPPLVPTLDGRAVATATEGLPDDPNVLGRKIPGFGGFYLDASGLPTVYLKDAARRAQVETALAPFLRREVLPLSVQVRQGNFDFAQLEQWFNRASPAVLDLAGVVFTDLDEGSNRLTVGVEHLAAEAGVRRKLAALDVPDDAVLVQQVPPIRRVATLRDNVRPVLGGLEINYTGGWRCTLGFSALHNGVGSFVTASHCSVRYGGSAGTLYSQPSSTVIGTSLGIEVADPAFFTAGACPVGRKCRYSDALRAEYVSGVPFQLGTIARTSAANDGSLTIVGAFSVVRESSGSLGSIANKVGRTTGWSQGRIVRTCTATNVLATNITLLCQHWVSGSVGEGDSGSPVFIGTARGGVSLAGLLWGGDAEGTIFTFSPISNIERELGDLTTF
jgi:hypothetical protein